MDLAHSRMVAQTRRISPGSGLNVDTAMPCARPVRPAWSEPSPQARSSTSSLWLEQDLDPGGLAVALEVRFRAAAALPLRQDDPAQVGELDRNSGADRWEELGVPHTASIG